MRLGEGMPRAGRSVGDQEERRSVMAALRKRLGAVWEECGKWRGSPRGAGETALEG